MWWSPVLVLVLGCSAHAAPPEVVAPTPPNVVVVLVDALRADHLGPFGYTVHPTTPNLDRFAARSVVFEHCFSQAGWTVPAVASLFSGVDPQAHRVFRYNPSQRLDMDELRGGEDTLAEVFARGGYETAALKKTVVLDPARGFAQGFDVFRVIGGDMVEGRAAGELTDAAIAWLKAERAPTRPFFLYLHYTDTHSSYRAPEPFLSRWSGGYRGALTGDHMEIERRFVSGGERPTRADLRHLLGLYDAEIAYWDANFGRLMQHLVVSGIDDRTVVVVVADHGEAFHDHGQWFHGHVWQENLRIPFLLKVPGVPPARYAHWTQLIDVAPTLADLAGLPRGARWTGRSQAGVVRGAPAPTGPVYGEYGAFQALITPDELKLILGDGPPKLFNLATDPAERNDLGPVRGILVDRLKPELLARVQVAQRLGDLPGPPGPAPTPPSPSGPAPSFTPEQIEALRALGYLGQ